MFDLIENINRQRSIPLVFDTMTDFKVFHEKVSVYKEKHAVRAEPLIEEMQSYWTNFAKFGNPNGQVENSNLMHWPEHHSPKDNLSKEHKKYYLYLSNKTKLKEQ